MKKAVLILLIAIIISLMFSSCSSETISPNILTTAWLTCQSASGVPTVHNFIGKAALVWNVHSQSTLPKSGSNAHFEQVGSLWLTNANFFILGNYSDTKYYSDYDMDNYLTQNLDEAGAFLCVSVSYRDIQKCTYHSGNNIIRTIAEADVKLVSWPDKSLIAEQHTVTESPDSCPPVIYGTSHSVYDVEMKNIDIWNWLLSYKR